MPMGARRPEGELTGKRTQVLLRRRTNELVFPARTDLHLGSLIRHTERRADLALITQIARVRIRYPSSFLLISPNSHRSYR
jgi:hypothetical protein